TATPVLLLAAVASVAIWWTRDRTPSFETVVGVSLPATATELRSRMFPGVDGGEYFASARMSEPEFAQLMGRLGLARNPAILSYYPGARRSQPKLEWWPRTDMPDGGETFFVVRTDATHDSYIVAWYEGGRLYLRRSFW